MTYYYCTCCDDKKKTESGKSPYREVLADDEGICLECGYYAVKTKEKINGNIYNYLFGKEKPEKGLDVSKCSIQYNRRNK